MKVCSGGNIVLIPPFWRSYISCGGRQLSSLGKYLYLEKREEEGMGSSSIFATMVADLYQHIPHTILAKLPHNDSCTPRMLHTHCVQPGGVSLRSEVVVSVKICNIALRTLLVTRQANGGARESRQQYLWGSRGIVIGAHSEQRN